MRFFWRRCPFDRSLDDPLLGDDDGSSEISRQPGELDDLVARFGRSLLNTSPEDISRLKTAVEHDNTEEISEIVESPDVSTNPSSNAAEYISIDMSQESFFKLAVEDCKTEWVKFFLENIADQSIPFDVGAAMMKENFNNLWLDYKILVENMTKQDVLGWDICTIEVPIETFTVENNVGSRVGTCNLYDEWLEASREGTGNEHWRSLNPKGVDKILKTSRGRKVNAIVKIYCFEDACQIGLDGIVRFFLMHNAPSSLFKTPFIEWVITYKWERIWKVLAFKDLALFLVLFVGFHISVIGYTSNMFAYIPQACGAALIIFLSIAVVLLLLLILRREYFQLRRCILDGRKMFPKNHFRGIRNYFCLPSNQIDLMLSVLILAMFASIGLHLADIYGTLSEIVLVVALAIAVLLMWAKAFHFMQGFQKSGIYVVMIRRVFLECAPYFLLLFGITIAFGMAMSVAFRDYSLDLGQGHEKRLHTLHFRNVSSLYDVFWSVQEAFKEENEENSLETFGTPFKSILTMIYAMVGILDPEILFHCGYLKRVMIALFVVYLFLQAIIMFNMLIASMGDAFDGVKAAEEELFLMARAKFIDHFESSLGNKAIQKIKRKIGKYLYVLMPVDKQLEESVPVWKGRIPTIKADVAKIVRDSQNQSSQNIDEMNRNTYEMFKTLREDIKNDMKNMEEGITKSLEERIRMLEQYFSDQNTRC